MTTTKDYNDGEWRAWSGGERPVHRDSVVEAISSSGHKAVCPAKQVYWSQPLLFRVTEQHIEPPKPLELWVNVYEKGGVSAYPAEDQAAYLRGRTGRTVHMREVLK